METAHRRRERLRFEGLDYEAHADGSSRVEVRLEWEDRRHTGTARGSGTMESDLRASAEATLQAAAAATSGRLQLGLVGIKAVRAFDGRVIIASVHARSAERQYRLLGAHALTEGDIPRAASLTVLDAINRILEPLMASISEAEGQRPEATDAGEP